MLWFQITELEPHPGSLLISWMVPWGFWEQILKTPRLINIEALLAKDLQNSCLLHFGSNFPLHLAKLCPLSDTFPVNSNRHSWKCAWDTKSTIHWAFTACLLLYQALGLIIQWPHLVLLKILYVLFVTRPGMNWAWSNVPSTVTKCNGVMEWIVSPPKDMLMS